MKTVFLFLIFCSSLFGENFLYIIHAKKGMYADDTLTLIDIDRSVTYFSPPPERRAGKTTINRFLLNLVSEKEEINAGFVFFTDTEHRYSDIPIVLSDPQYDLDTRELSFKVKLVAESDTLYEEMEEVNLFVDNVPGEPQ